MAADRSVAFPSRSSWLRGLGLRGVPGGVLAIVLLATAIPARGQQPGQPVDQAVVNSAIQKGVQYLRGTQNPSGSWGKGTQPGGDGGWVVGYACLAGLTLIECGTSPDDPGIKAAYQGVRASVGELDSTYEVALAILFLDRMGDKKDRKLIQLLAGRLIAGQSPTGGWGYKVPKKSQAEIDVLFSALRRLSPPQNYTGPGMRDRPSSLGLCIKTSDDVVLKPAQGNFDREKARLAAIAALPVGMKRYPAFLDPTQLILEDPKDKGSDPVTPTTDNSNTHFAMLGLWAARKHDVPTDRSFSLLARRYKTSQNADGTWSYAYVRNGEPGGAHAMTNIALLGLAIGHVMEADPSVRPEKDPRVINAFSALSKQIGEPAGRIDNRPLPKDIGGLYYMWGMERIAVLYDVRQLDKKDWYTWGAEILLCHQKSDGSWLEGGYPGEHPVLNTCFALLFLKRANLTPDLSRKLTVDTSALTQKVSDKVNPNPVPPPMPTPPPEPEPMAEQPAPPPPVVAPKPKAEPTPVAAPAASSPAPPPEPKSSSPWLYLLLLPVLGVLMAILFVLRKKKEDEDEGDEDRPRKKGKGKKKQKEDDADRPRKKRSRAKAEAVEDDEE